MRGMAHFPGTGPKDAICRNCWHFDFKTKRPFQKQKCRKYMALMGGQDKQPPAISHKSAACKYFEARP